MEAQPREIRRYTTADGKVPFDEWSDSLRDRKARVRIKARLDRVELGNFGDCKPEGEGVLALRVNYGPGYRVYFGQDGSEAVILLCGGDKSTQDRDIYQAKKYWADYHERRKRTNKR